MASKNSKKDSIVAYYDDANHRKWKKNREYRRGVLKSELNKIKNDSKVLDRIYDERKNIQFREMIERDLKGKPNAPFFMTKEKRTRSLEVQSGF